MDRDKIISVLEKMCTSFYTCKSECPMFSMDSEMCSFTELSDKDLDTVVAAVINSSLDDTGKELMELCGIFME